MSKKITDLPDAGALTGAEYVPVVQGGITKKTPASSLGSPGGGNATGTEHLAALRAKVGTTDKEFTSLAGTLAFIDGGGGTFFWDAASTAADDDGLTVKPTAIGGGSPGRWKRVHDGTHIHAKWFGAKGDGPTDDAPALTNAITACFATTPPTPLVLPPGNYGILTPLTVPASACFIMRGTVGYQGIGTKITALAAMDQCMHIPAGFIVEGVTFNGNGLAKYGVRCDNASFSKFSHCEFENALYDGCWLNSFADVPILENCQARGNGVVFCATSTIAAQYALVYSGLLRGTAMTEVVQSSTNDDITLTVEADQHTIVASAAGGTIDFTTLGLRYGDVLRLGGGTGAQPGAGAQFFQVCQVLNPTTILVAAKLRLPTVGAYTEWAISRGDGVRNAGANANNSQLIAQGGLYMQNAGSGIATPGGGQEQIGGSANFIFGMALNGLEPQQNGAAGILVGQQTCYATPTALAGITYAVTNGSATVTASASVDGLISPGAFFSFATQPSAMYHVIAVSGATITLGEPYTGGTDAATTIYGFDVVGGGCTNVRIQAQYAESDVAAQIMISQCYYGEIDAVHGGTLASVSADILTDEATLKIAPGEFIAPGVTGVGGFSPRSTAEEIALGGFKSTVPNASIANMRTGYEIQATIPAAGTPIDTTRSYLWVLTGTDVKMTATPTFAPPNASPNTPNYTQLLYVENSGSGGNFILQDKDILPGSGLQLKTPILTLPPGGYVVLIYQLYAGVWQEVCRGGRLAETSRDATIAAAYAIDSSGVGAIDDTIFASAGPYNVTLPPFNAAVPDMWRGRKLTLVSTDASTITLVPSGTETINGGASLATTSQVTVQCDASGNWHRVGT